MLVERTEHPGWLSNAYLVAEGAGGHGVIVDANGVLEPLLERVGRDGIEITHLLVTHRHQDHVAGLAELRRRFDVPVVGHPLTAEHVPEVDQTLADGEAVRSGSLELRALETPGHVAGHLAFLAAGSDLFTADLLFRRTVGGTRAPGATGFADLRRSIMEKTMALPHEVRVHPGHSVPTTLAEEWDENPFVRVWRGLDAEGTDRCTVRGEPATLVVWAGDYDGGNKAWVRFDDGREDVVGGSQVERG